MRQTEVPSLHLVNFSALPVMVESVDLLPVPGEPQRVYLAEGAGEEFGRGIGAMLAPGTYRFVELPTPRELASRLPAPTKLRLEYGVGVNCVYPGRGRLRVTYAVEFGGWDLDAKVRSIRLVAVQPAAATQYGSSAPWSSASA